MSFVSKTFSKEVAAVLRNGSHDSLSQSLTPAIALKCLVQLSQNINFSKKNRLIVADICRFVTQNAVLGFIPWNEVIKVVSIISRFSGDFFYIAGVTDFKMTVAKDELPYSWLLLLSNLPHLRKEWIRLSETSHPSINQIAPLISDTEYSLIYQTFTYCCYGHAYIFSTETLKGVILQCKKWGYEEGLKRYERFFIERLDNISDVLSEHCFACFNDLSQVMEHGRLFFETYRFHLFEEEEKTVYIAYNGRYDADSSLSKILPSDRDRRIFLKSQLERQGSIVFSDLKVEVVEFTVIQNTVAPARKIIDFREYKDFEKKMETAKKGTLSLKHKTLLLSGNCGLSDEMVLGLVKMIPFSEVNFYQFELEMHLLRSIARFLPDLKRLRLIKCPSTPPAALAEIPDLFLNLSCFSLIGGAFSEEILLKYISMPLENLALRASRVEWPSDLTGLNKLKTLELAYMKISEKDLSRILFALNEVKTLIIFNVALFKIDMLSNVYQTIENLTLGANYIDKDYVDHLSRCTHLKTITIQGELLKNVETDFKEFVEKRNLKLNTCDLST